LNEDDGFRFPPSLVELRRTGDIATCHGLVTDAQTRVLDVRRNPIPGLFAVGNDAASIFGGSYPGATLGPAMTFGYICGKRQG
jgi:predicted oxidoreductase